MVFVGLRDSDHSGVGKSNCPSHPSPHCGSFQGSCSTGEMQSLCSITGEIHVRRIHARNGFASGRSVWFQFVAELRRQPFVDG